MKTLVSFILFSVVTWASSSLGDAAFRVSPGGTLEVNLSSADIIINVWNKNEVLVSSDNLDKFNISSTSNRIVISRSQGNPVTSMNINIPSHFNIRLNTSAGDHIINGNLRGNIDIVNSGGDITFNDVNGSVAISTGGGDIFGHDISGSAVIKSSGGDISLNNIKGRLSAETGGGNIKIGSSRLTEIISSSGGNLLIKEASGNGKISTGGGNIDINSADGNLEILSYGGNIRINNTGGRINVVNNGGDIRIKEAGGSIKALNQSGNIYINFSPNARVSSVKTLNGDIRAGIAPNLGAHITAKKKDPDWWRDEGGSEEVIKSDFRLVSFQRNKRNQEIIAQYQTGSGGTKINLESSFGEIIIRKN